MRSCQRHACIAVLPARTAAEGRDAVAHVLYDVSVNIATSFAASAPSDCLVLLVHILEFYLVAILDENLGNVGVVAVTAAADAGRAAVGRHYHPVL